MSTSERVAAVFHVLTLIRHDVDATHDLATRAIADTATDRARADEIRDSAMHASIAKPFGTLDLADISTLLTQLIKEDPARFHALSCRLIAEREQLANALANIRVALDHVDIPPRMNNSGRAARGR